MLKLKKITEFIREQFQSIGLTEYDGEADIYKIDIINPETMYDMDTLYICHSPRRLGKDLPLPDQSRPCFILSTEIMPKPFQTVQFTRLPDAVTLYLSIVELMKNESRLDHQIQDVYSSLYHGSGLKDVLATAEHYLHSPIGVCDSSYNFIDISPMMHKFPYGITTVNGHSFLSEAAVESLRRNRFEFMIYNEKGAFCINSPDYPNNRWCFCAIRIQNVHVGHVAVCLDRIPTSYELRLITELADVCAIEMQKHDFFLARTGLKYENFIVDLLEGKFNDVNIISERLQLLDRKFGKYFCLIVMKCTEPHDSDLFNKRQISNLRHNYPGSMSVVYKDSIVLFLNQETPIKLDSKFTRRLREFAELNRMHVGISQPFADILKIQAFYIQAENALSMGEVASKDKSELLFFADELFPTYLFQKCDYTGLEIGIHYHIHHLQGYDNEFHTEFIPTLRAYLDNDRNATKAAEALHIHRSTFFYRVKKIEDLLDISFSDSRLMFLYELSFKVWDYLCK